MASGIGTKDGVMMRWVSFIQWFSVCWIALTVGAVVASAPLAWRILLEGEATTPGETLVLAWPVIMVVLAVPSAIALLIIRSDMWGETRMAKWIYGEAASYETVERMRPGTLRQEAARAAEEAGLTEPRRTTASLGRAARAIHALSGRFARGSDQIGETEPGQSTDGSP